MRSQADTNAGRTLSLCRPDPTPASTATLHRTSPHSRGYSGPEISPGSESIKPPRNRMTLSQAQNVARNGGLDIEHEASHLRDIQLYISDCPLAAMTDLPTWAAPSSPRRTFPSAGLRNPPIEYPASGPPSGAAPPRIVVSNIHGGRADRAAARRSERIEPITPAWASSSPRQGCRRHSDGSW
jgi:hypothetical protein